MAANAVITEQSNAPNMPLAKGCKGCSMKGIEILGLISGILFALAGIAAIFFPYGFVNTITSYLPSWAAPAAIITGEAFILGSMFRTTLHKTESWLNKEPVLEPVLIYDNDTDRNPLDLENKTNPPQPNVKPSISVESSTQTGSDHED